MAFFPKYKTRILSILLGRAGAFLAVTVLILIPPRSLAAGRQVLQGHVPKAVSEAAPWEGSVPDTQRLALCLGLPLQNPRQLQQLLKDLYDSRSPRFRRFLLPEEFTEQFGPTRDDYRAVQAFARSAGLSVVKTYPDRVMLDVSGTAADIRRAFHINLNYYRHPEGGRFFAPDAEPSLDLDVPLLSVSGLDNFQRPKHRMRRVPSTGRTSFKAAPKAGTGPGGNYQGRDFRDTYVPDSPATLTGAGQLVGLMEFDGFYASDISYYQSVCNPPFSAPAPTTVLIDGFSGTPTDASFVDEVTLDIEMIISLAPGAQVVVYEAAPGAPFNTAANHILAAMCQAPLCRQVSSSWGGFGNPTTRNLLVQLAAQGQGYYEAAGDYGSYVTGAPTPSVSGDPSLYLSSYETLVGGTELTTVPTGGSPASIVWSLETTWNDNIGAGGGGICTSLLPIPSYQTPVPMTTNSGSTQWRNLPDVSMVAAQIRLISNNVQAPTTNSYDGTVEGTSASSPLWAAFSALVNQQAQGAGKGVLGFANPALYAIGTGPNYTNLFHDVADNSSNFYYWPSQSGPYTAVGGFDRWAVLVASDASTLAALRGAIPGK